MAIIEYKGLKIDTDTLKREDMPTDVFCEIFDLCGADVAVSILINMTVKKQDNTEKGNLA